MINLSLHSYKVDDARELAFSADGELNGYSVTFKSVFHHLNNMEEVGAHDVHFINVNHSRYAVVVSLTPNCFRLRLNAALSTKYCYRTVEYTK